MRIGSHVNLFSTFPSEKKVVTFDLKYFEIHQKARFRTNNIYKERCFQSKHFKITEMFHLEIVFKHCLPGFLLNCILK